MEYSPWAEQMSIMLVNEKAFVCNQVKRMLESEGYKVLTARNSVEALVLAADYPFSIDVLITGMDTRVYQNGLELAACFRILRPETRIVLSACSDTGSLPKRISGFANEGEYLSEPFTKFRLLKAIDSVLLDNYEMPEAA
jgi:DNA-binding response OmpR family regulator